MKRLFTSHKSQFFFFFFLIISQYMVKIIQGSINGEENRKICRLLTAYICNETFTYDKDFRQFEPIHYRVEEWRTCKKV